MINWFAICLLGGCFVLQLILYGLLFSHPDFPAYMAAGITKIAEEEDYKNCRCNKKFR